MSSAVADHPPEAPPQQPRFGRFGKATWALAVALVAFAGSLSSVVFTFLPQLKPDPRDSVAATLSVFAIEPNVSLGDYVRRTYGSIAFAPAVLRQTPPVELQFRGELVYVRTRVDGFKHRQVRLVATIYDGRTQQLSTKVNDNSPLPARTVSLDTPSTTTVQLFWILSLQNEPPAFVRIEMYDETRMLAVADSPVIRNGLGPLPPA